MTPNISQLFGRIEMCCMVDLIQDHGCKPLYEVARASLRSEEIPKTPSYSPRSIRSFPVRQFPVHLTIADTTHKPTSERPKSRFFDCQVNLDRQIIDFDFFSLSDSSRFPTNFIVWRRLRAESNAVGFYSLFDSDCYLFPYT